MIQILSYIVGGLFFFIAVKQTRLESESVKLKKEVIQLRNKLGIKGTFEREIGQNLSCLTIQLEVVEKFKDKRPEASCKALEEARTLAGMSIEGIRALIRLSDCTENCR